ncbi:MAG: M23 family metallopeptidase [Firmicutes bacterium]|nr:M23 family metallopeptidase [Bacillota bacterium]
MKLDQNSAASAKERRLYYVVLSILAIVTVAAIIITIAAGGEDPVVDPLQQVKENPIPVEESKAERVLLEPEDGASEPVSGDMAEENSEIETVKAEESSEEENSQVEAQMPEESETAEEVSVPEVAEDPQEEPVPQVVAEFDAENDTMIWPVSGNVVMEYSADALIYDETLDQYRANDSISIAATTGEEVLCAAAGTVKSIGENDVLGNYVVISHGNGLETTYGQLQDAVDVVVDQVVDKGEIIGYIAEPTWYCLALGSHVQFQVTQDGVAVDPTIYLENSLEE